MQEPPADADLAGPPEGNRAAGGDGCKGRVGTGCPDRGHWTEKKGVWILPTYHPSALLRDESKKPEAWEDMKSLKRKLTELGLYPDIYGTGEPEGSV